MVHHDKKGFISYLSLNHYSDNIGYSEYPNEFREIPETTLDCINEKNKDNKDTNDEQNNQNPHHVQFLDDKNTKCLLYEHCINFDEKAKKCQVCESYYYPNEEGKCEIIGNHCMTGTPTKCLKCEDDYYVNDDGICEKKN